MENVIKSREKEIRKLTKEKDVQEKSIGTQEKTIDLLQKQTGTDLKV